MFQVEVSEPGEVRVVNVKDPAAGPHELLLRLVSGGICGGDVALVQGQNAVGRYPTVLGHECVAQVVTAPLDSDLQSGEYVVVFPTVSCGHCAACRGGRENQCPEMVVMGLSYAKGCFSELLCVTRDQCIPIPEAVAITFGALVEPVAVGWHVTSRATIQPGERVLVIGAGVVGMVSALVGRARGGAEFGFVDRFESRRDVLSRLGFDRFTTAVGDEALTWVASQFGAVDVVLDTVTSQATTELAVASLRPGGRLVEVASPKPSQLLPIPYGPIYLKELTVIATRNYTRQDFCEARDLLHAGVVDPRPLVSRTLPLGQFAIALELLASHPQEHLKILLEGEC